MTEGNVIDPLGDFPVDYMYNNTPSLFYAFWVVGSVSALACCAVSSLNVKRHRMRAKTQGFGKDEMMPSYGARADRIIHLLFVPPVCALTACGQMFLPGASGIFSLVRTLQLALVMVKIIELLFLLAGSQKVLMANMPEEPTPVFGRPPMCCIFGWNCCARKVQVWHLRFFVGGLKQFNVLVPAIGLIGIYTTSRFNPKHPLNLACEILEFISTVFGMWCFRSLLPLMLQAVEKANRTKIDLDMVGNFVVFEMIASNILSKIIALVVAEDFDSGTWAMSHQKFAVIISGMTLCVAQFFLALLALRAFPADSVMYPAVDIDTELPPDAYALLDMNGIDPQQWHLLQFIRKVSGLPLPEKTAGASTEKTPLWSLK